MKVALISDVHSNAEALKSVLDDAYNHDVSDFWFLGDAVGRGNDPIPILKLIALHLNKAYWVLGNHDAMFRDLILPGEKNGHQPFPVYQFNDHLYEATGEVLPKNVWEFTIPTAIELIIKNRLKISAEMELDSFWRCEFNKEKFLPQKINTPKIDFYLVHGSLNAKVQSDHIENYIYPWHRENVQGELEALAKQPGDQDICKVLCMGHTHIPFMISGESSQDYDVIKLVPEREYTLNAPLTLINPGSVGQPRDWVPRAAYMILDLNKKSVMLRKVHYDWRKVADALIGYDQLRRYLMTASGTSDMPYDWVDHYKQIKEDD